MPDAKALILECIRNHQMIFGSEPGYRGVAVSAIIEIVEARVYKNPEWPSHVRVAMNELQSSGAIIVSGNASQSPEMRAKLG